MQQSNPEKRRQAPAVRPNTLGLHGRDLADLLDDFDITDPIDSSQRDFVRWPFRCSSLEAKLLHPGGSTVTIRVACRNLSQGGMSLLHSAFLHTGTRCTVQLPHPTQGAVPIAGRVVRCTHRSGMVHEIGVAFSKHLDVRTFVPSLRNDVFLLERVDPALLTGRVLCVDDCENSIKIFAHHLRDSRIEIAVRKSGEALPEGPFDLVVVGHPVAHEDQMQFLGTIREREPRAAILVLTSELPQNAKQALSALNPDAVLVRPIEQEPLLRALGEYLIVQRQLRAPSTDPCATPDDARRTQDLSHIMLHCGQRLEAAMNKLDAAACRALCVQMAEVAPALGLHALGRLAAQTAGDLTPTMGVEKSLRSLRAMIAASARLQASAA